MTLKLDWKTIESAPHDGTWVLLCVIFYDTKGNEVSRTMDVAYFESIYEQWMIANLDVDCDYSVVLQEDWTTAEAYWIDIPDWPDEEK